jgi:hypothetical protein
VIHSEEEIATRLPEPADGTTLVVYEGGNDYKVIWRDDAEAKGWGGHEDERWFNDGNSDPMAFYQHVQYAEAVYPLGPAIFEG